MRHDQNIGKQDRRIEIEPPERLQRHFARQLGIIAQIKERSGLRPQLPVFRQIASGLAHEPDRAPFRLAFPKNVEQRFPGHALLHNKREILKVN